MIYIWRRSCHLRTHHKNNILHKSIYRGRPLKRFVSKNKPETQEARICTCVRVWGSSSSFFLMASRLSLSPLSSWWPISSTWMSLLFSSPGGGTLAPPVADARMLAWAAAHLRAGASHLHARIWPQGLARGDSRGLTQFLSHPLSVLLVFSHPLSCAHLDSVVVATTGSAAAHAWMWRGAAAHRRRVDRLAWPCGWACRFLLF